MQIRTLLAVSLATAAPAAAGPAHVQPKRQGVAKPAPKPTPAKPAVAAKPRVLPTGSPACGNTQTKLTDQERAAILACLAKEAEAKQ